MNSQESDIPAGMAADDAGYVQALGLTERPFAHQSLNRLYKNSPTVQTSVREVLESCWYTEEVVLVSLQYSHMMPYVRGVIQHNLGSDFVVAQVVSDMLMTPEMVLEQLVVSLGLAADADKTADELQTLIRRFAADLNGTSRELLLLIEDAQELSGESLAAVLELSDNYLETSCPRLVLLGDSGLEGRVSDVVDASAVTLKNAVIGSVTGSEMAWYILQELREAGYDGPDRLDGRLVERALQSALQTPDQTFRVIENQLNENSEGKPTTGKRYPLTHQVAVGLLLAVLAILYSGDGFLAPDGTSGSDTGTAPAADNGQPVEAQTAITLLGEVQAGLTADSENHAATDTAATVVSVQTPATAPDPVKAIAESGQSAETEAEVVVQTPSVVEQSATGPVVTVAPDGLQITYAALQKVPDGHFYVQLLGTRSEEKVVAFIEQNGISKEAVYARSSYQGQPWYIVVLGSFSDREEAQQRLKNLPEELRALQPWIRTAVEIRRTMQEPA